MGAVAYQMRDRKILSNLGGFLIWYYFLFVPLVKQHCSVCPATWNNANMLPKVSKVSKRGGDPLGRSRHEEKYDYDNTVILLVRSGK